MKRTQLMSICAVATLLLACLLCYYQNIPPVQAQDKRAATGKTEVLVPLPIQLPTAQIGGTPPNLAGVTNLEKSSTKARTPFLAPPDVTNVALHKPVTSSVVEPMLGELAWIVDGNKEVTDGSLVELDPFKQYVTIDLEATHEIYAILFWHYHKEKRVYFDVLVQIANDPDFLGKAQTLYNNDNDNSSGQGIGTDRHYVENAEGRLVDALAVKARYVRLYSQGNSDNDQNHYLEIEVYGRPVRE
jgi:hypothetical protein